MGTCWLCLSTKKQRIEENNVSRPNILEVPQVPSSSSSKSSRSLRLSKISSLSSSEEVEYCLKTSDHATWSKRTKRTKRTEKSDRTWSEKAEKSNRAWSERTETMERTDCSNPAFNSSDDEVDEEKSNKEIFEKLRLDPKFSEFFSFTFPDMRIKRKIAEGVQAEIFTGEFTMMQKKFPYVLKVFKGDYLVEVLQFQFPNGMLKGGNSIFPRFFSGTSSILGGMVLDGDRFAIVLKKEWGDLRNLMDLRLLKNEGPPFEDQCAKKIIFEIAMGMGQLHKHEILHRNLKSYNVLVSIQYSKFPQDIDDDAFNVKIFDFESSLEVLGVGFWKAPEIMQALKDGNMSDGIFTTKTHVYSFAITCFEIVMGHLPFASRTSQDYNVVLAGKRPQLLHNMDVWLKELIEKCWHPHPLQGPEFEVIVKEMKSNYLHPIVHIIQEEIKASKSHWSQPDPSLSRDDLETDTNWAIFTKLRLRRQYLNFFVILSTI